MAPKKKSVLAVISETMKETLVMVDRVVRKSGKWQWMPISVTRQFDRSHLLRWWDEFDDFFAIRLHSMNDEKYEERRDSD